MRFSGLKLIHRQVKQGRQKKTLIGATDALVRFDDSHAIIFLGQTLKLSNLQYLQVDTLGAGPIVQQFYQR